MKSLMDSFMELMYEELCNLRDEGDTDEEVLRLIREYEEMTGIENEEK